MKLGTFITNVRPEAIASNIRKAEEIGFESAWIGDHLIPPIEYRSRYPYSADGSFAAADSPRHDPMLALAFAAGITSRIKLATGVFIVPMRSAIATAKAVASLDVLSNGRVIFGVGVGWFKEEFEMLGANFKDRALRTREYIELMKALWTQDKPVYDGKTIGVKGVYFNPKPVQKPHPPVVVGGTTDLAIKRTIRYGDGWYAIANTIDHARSLIAKLKEEQRAANRIHPIEITLSLRPGHTQTLDELMQLADLGVDRALIGLPRHALNDDELVRFHDEVMTKL